MVLGEYGMCFCSPGTKLVEHYACRGTKLIASHIFIPGYKVLCGAVAWSGFITFYESVMGAGTKCKNRDKLINYTVRVALNPTPKTGWDSLIKIKIVK
jgi:hypothetical protein